MVYDQQWQSFDGFGYHFAGYRDSGLPQYTYAPSLTTNGFTELDRQANYESPYNGERIDPTIPQQIVDQLPYGPTYIHSSSQMQDTSVRCSNLYPARHDTPWSTSGSSAFSPPEYSADSSPELQYAQAPTHHRTISMTEVQPFVDCIPEPTFDIDRAIYKTPNLQSFELHHHQVANELSSPELASTEPNSPSQDDDSDYVEPKDRRTVVPRHSVNAKKDSHRTGKHTKRRLQVTKTTPRRPTSATMSKDDPVFERPYHCLLAPYGCKSTFPSKNEWKRHISTQHMRLGYWLCDRCPPGQGKKSNHFNRRDLFMQHVRRMHTDHKQQQQKQQQQQQQQQQQSAGRKKREKHMKKGTADQIAIDAADRCHRQLRLPPTKSICVVCKEVFSGSASWDKRMEHMGKHFEGGRRGIGNDLDALFVGRWHVDNAVESWMIKQGILLRTGDGDIVMADEAA